MEHPLIHTADSLTLEELGKKISELQGKLNIARRHGNGYLCDQLSMAIETFRQAHGRKVEQTYKKDTEGKDWLKDKIDIS